MAIIRDGTIVSPGVDTMTSSDLDNPIIEPGIYTLASSKTILGQTSSRWTIICLASNDASNPVCYTQLWIPAQNNLTGANQNLYVRTINTAGTGFGEFTAISNSGTAINNSTSYPTELYIQSSAPTTASGKNIIWIDTST